MKRQLNERISDIVYHYTALRNAYGILKDGQINLVPTMKNSSESEHGTSKFYFLSLTRSRYGAYHKEKSNGVLFELDGKKLQNKFGGKATDYWGDTSMGKLDNMDEMEDRLFTDKPHINIYPYIKQASILTDSVNKRANKYVIGIYTLLKKKGIPAYIYTNTSDWLNNRKENALSMEQIKQFNKDETEKIPKLRTTPKRKNEIDAFIELYHKDKRENLTDLAQRVLRQLKGMDGIKPLMTTIHNEAGSLSSGSSDSVKKLFALMKREKYRSIQNMADDIVKKWDKIDEKEQREQFLKTNKDRISAINAILSGEKEFNPYFFHKEGDIDSAQRIINNTLLGMDRYDIEMDTVREKFPVLKDNPDRFKIMDTMQKISERMSEGQFD